MYSEQYSKTAEEDLAALAPTDEEAYRELIFRCLPSVRRIAAIYQNSPADRDDLVSEGILGVMSAVRTYSKEKGAGFMTYACKCAANRMINALKKAQRISTREDPREELPETSRTLESPEKIVADREFLREVIVEAQTSLSELEWGVLNLYISGYPHDTIAKTLGIDRKAVDNALGRLRRKLRRKFR